MSHVRLFENGVHIGFVDPRKCETIGGTDFGSRLVPYKGQPRPGYCLLSSLNDGTYILTDCTLVESSAGQVERHCHRADRIDKNAAVEWLLENNLKFPAAWRAERGFVDFTPPTHEDYWAREIEENYEEWAEIIASDPEGLETAGDAEIVNPKFSVPQNGLGSARPVSLAEKVLIQAFEQLQAKHATEWFVCAKIATVAGYKPDYARRVLGGMVKKGLFESWKWSRRLGR